MKRVGFFIRFLILAGLVYLKLTKVLKRVEFDWLHPVIDTVVNFLIVYLAAKIIISLLSFSYRKRKNLVPPQKDNVLIGLENLYYIILAGTVIMAILGFMGIDPRTLFTSLSIVAAAIAIISKDYLVEIISGMIISFSNDLSLGDDIKIGEQRGKVMDISITKITLLNQEDDLVFIPNNKVFSSEIVNYTKSHIKKVNIDFVLDIQFIKTIEELESDLIHCLKDYHEHIENDSFYLKIVTINKDSLAMKFQYILNSDNRTLEKEIRRKTVRRLVNYIKEKGSNS